MSKGAKLFPNPQLSERESLAYNDTIMQFKAPLLAFTLIAAILAAPAAIADDGLEFFESRIRPVLATKCYMCHSADAKTRMGGLTLDTKDGIREGGQRGHAVVPNDIESSLIIGALRYEGGLKMPPTGKLSEEVVQDFEKWVRMGAPDPRETDVQASQSTIDLDKGREYWAFRPPARVPPPAVRENSWPRGAIDQFVLAALEERGLRPTRDAAKTDLLRRLTFDLTGLPPTPEELSAFLENPNDRAYADVVDRLLESDRFGERWGRHWLDVVRYADSVGRTRNLPFPVAWKYRDYVIRSFNEDKPYDRFVREQVAGDLLPYDSRHERVENQVATGFLAMGAHDLNEPDPKQFEMDVADEMINVTSRSFLALTVGCARCHDHKFDPIPTKDYYAMAAIFRSSDVRSGLRRRPRFNAGYFRAQRLVALDGVPEFTRSDAAEIRTERDRLWTELQAAEEARDRVKCRELARALGKLPIPENLAMGVVEAEQPVPTKVNIGGDPHTLGEPVERGFVQVLFNDGADLPAIGAGESGRLQLAHWLTRRDNPLTSRVMANRIWHSLLGSGIVSDVDNFGSMARLPKNQPLLDYLAVQFMDQGWSVKSLIREIVMSRTYRLATATVPENFQIDPDNDYLWRANIRRLEVEALRDSVLLVSGELETGAPPPSPVHAFDRNQLLRVGNRQVRKWEVEENYRSVYVPVIRNATNRLFESFDFPEPSETHGAREVTTGPAQALFMMNNDFVRNNAHVAAERLMASRRGDSDRIRHAFRQALSRDPSPSELDRAIARVQELRGAPAAPESDPAEVRAAARAWLGRFLAAFLDSRPTKGEMAAAMEYLASDRPGAKRSAQAVGSAMREGLRRPNAPALIQMVETVIGRQLSDEEKSVARDNLQAWRASRPEGSGKDGQIRMAGSANAEQQAWTWLYHALYNSAEFRYRN